MDDSNIKNNYLSSTKRNLRNISRSFFLLLPMVFILLFFMGVSYSEVIPFKVTPIVSGIITMVIGLFFFLKILLDLRRLKKGLGDVFINKKDRSKLMKPGNKRVLISIQLFLIVIIGANVFLEIFYLVNDYARIGFPLARLIITSSALFFCVLLLGLSVVKKQYSNDNNLFDEESYVTEKLYNQVNKVWLGLKVFIVFGVLYIFNVLIQVFSGVT